MEIWKSIQGYEGLYEISSNGRVKSCANLLNRKEKILKPWYSLGYPKVQLNKDGVKKKVSVHRLVAQAFIMNPMQLPFVNHINADRSDSRVENLEWCTHNGNMLHYVATRQKKTPTEVIQSGLVKFMKRYDLDKHQMQTLLDSV